jgi:hypothetical protein
VTCFWATALQPNRHIWLVNHFRDMPWDMAALHAQDLGMHPIEVAQVAVNGARSTATQPAAAMNIWGAQSPIAAVPSELRDYAEQHFEVTSRTLPELVERHREMLLRHAVTHLRQGMVRMCDLALESRDPNPLSEIRTGRDPSAGQQAALLGIFGHITPPWEAQHDRPDH